MHSVPQLYSVRTPSKREVIYAIKSMKNRKAAGSDSIPAELLKLDSPKAADMLLSLFQWIWQREIFPKEWKEGIVIKIPKKGDLSLCNNWWGIILLVVISKIFNKIILERIMYALKNNLHNEQAGFCPNRSCVDQINTLKIITAQPSEFQSPLYMVFVDYKRAFDSLKRECIWKELKARGLPSKFLNLIKEGYNSFSCTCQKWMICVESQGRLNWWLTMPRQQK